jgi:hypothetical protein
LGKIKHEMSEDSHMDEVVETTPVEEAVEEPAAVVEEVVEEAVEPEPPVVPKKKRKRSEAQINALAAARKSKMSKMSSKKTKKPVKIERQSAESPSAEFSWTKEICKASILASLGLASIYVQQKCAQTPPPEVVQVEEKPKKKPSVKTGGKDPFAGYR